MTLQKINPNKEEQDPFWEAMEGGDGASQYESTSAESSMEDSTNSADSSSSIDLVEDASSSTSSSSSSSTLISHTNGPLYELSELMAQLPISRGLSKFYQGKSQSYTSLASVKSLEDLAKKVTTVTPYRSKIKSCKSYAGALDVQKCYSPKATISKRGSSSRGSLLSSLGKRGSLAGDC
ncbi:hypothetical protein P3X46_019480 [Hevea brasiliensis]|uniref:Oxidative stress 3 n=1 Tax=Hevea brasiliensis TaxID=3981 RepID=A0ABQ9LLS0_HEVBR|nr:protein OXIDATIVE STRESS 3 [Hevea brasiliensis]KAJ9167890.1 hypothetical protein P3X46_019480 [Hevea brasiliensis]